MDDCQKNQKPEEYIGHCRRVRNKKIASLHNFDRDYSLDKFIVDLKDYFEGEVDFNLDKIKKEISKPGELKRFIAQACQKETHPVVEFLQEIFKDL